MTCGFLCQGLVCWCRIKIFPWCLNCDLFKVFSPSQHLYTFKYIEELQFFSLIIRLTGDNADNKTGIRCFVEKQCVYVESNC